MQQTITGVRSASEPWAVAAFSADGKALVIGDPKEVRVFRYEATAGRERPRWAAVASASDQKQLLRAILENPDEDTPRLMYADWLDEHDDAARAEFIRLQCKLADRLRREHVPADDPDTKREFELQRQLGARWLAEMPALAGCSGRTSGAGSRPCRWPARRHWRARAEDLGRGAGRVALLTGLNAAGARRWPGPPRSTDSAC